MSFKLNMITQINKHRLHRLERGQITLEYIVFLAVLIGVIIYVSRAFLPQIFDSSVGFVSDSIRAIDYKKGGTARHELDETCMVGCCKLSCRGEPGCNGLCQSSTRAAKHPCWGKCTTN